MRIHALDLVKQLIDENCKNLHYLDTDYMDKMPSNNIDHLIIRRSDNAWTEWVIVFKDSCYILCQDTGGSYTTGIFKTVTKLFGKKIEPILIHNPSAAIDLTKLLKKLDVVVQ